MAPVINPKRPLAIDLNVGSGSILLKNPSMGVRDADSGVLDPLARMRSWILGRSERSISARRTRCMRQSEFFNRIVRFRAFVGESLSAALAEFRYSRTRSTTQTRCVRPKPSSSAARPHKA